MCSEFMNKFVSAKLGLSLSETLACWYHHYITLKKIQDQACRCYFSSEMVIVSTIKNTYID